MSTFSVLSWDSEKFGFIVARASGETDVGNLKASLAAARNANARLVYVTRPQALGDLPAELLHQFGGRLVDERVTFVAEVAPVAAASSIGSRVSEEIQFEDFSEPVASDELILLARASGIHSRFNTDPRIDRRVFESIYDTWIARSVRRELAERVVVARRGQRLAGLVTLSAAPSARSEIGLLAVDERARGLGIGRALVREGFRWAAQRGLTVAQVVTQRRNDAACQLYTSCGYAIERIDRVYHFWPFEGVDEDRRPG
jgi:dTDP-4-amino-4,6-dideoxy-D-galactose acyltransferase